MPIPVLGARVEGFFFQTALITVAEFKMHCRMLDHPLFTRELYQHHLRSALCSLQWTARCHKGVPRAATHLQRAQRKDKATGNGVFSVTQGTAFFKKQAIVGFLHVTCRVPAPCFPDYSVSHLQRIPCNAFLPALLKWCVWRTANWFRSL